MATGFANSEMLKNLHIHRLKSTNPDQHGNVDIYTKFQPSIQEDQKYLLNHDADGIADCKLAACLTLIL